MVRFRNFVMVIAFAGKSACVLLYLPKDSSYSHCDIGCIKLSIKQLSFYYGYRSHGRSVTIVNSERAQ